MKGIVDRFEGEYVVIEINGKTQDFKRDQVDSEVKEGDVVVLQNGIWRTDLDETNKRSSDIKKLMNELWAD